MPFAIIALDKPDSGTSARRKPPGPSGASRPPCRQAAGRRRGAGRRCATPVGSLIVFDSEDRAEVEAFVAADPFTKAGLFASVSIYPWRKVFFAGRR